MSERVRDPVCGMPIWTSDAVGSIERDGMTYFFCSARCEQQFRSSLRQDAEQGVADDGNAEQVRTA